MFFCPGRHSGCTEHEDLGLPWWVLVATPSVITCILRRELVFGIWVSNDWDTGNPFPRSDSF